MLQDNEEISNGGQFQVYSKFLEGNLYQGELKIVNVVKANYGSYICEVANKNMTVTDMFTINVDGTSIPDAPYDLKFINSTHDSITVAWKPGFNGGLTQTFIVIIRKSNMNTKTTIELKEEDGTIYSIKGRQSKNFQIILVLISITMLNYLIVPLAMCCRSHRHISHLSSLVSILTCTILDSFFYQTIIALYQHHLRQV